MTVEYIGLCHSTRISLFCPGIIITIHEKHQSLVVLLRITVVRTSTSSSVNSELTKFQSYTTYNITKFFYNVLFHLNFYFLSFSCLSKPQLGISSQTGKNPGFFAIFTFPDLFVSKSNLSPLHHSLHLGGRLSKCKMGVSLTELSSLCGYQDTYKAYCLMMASRI